MTKNLYIVLVTILFSILYLPEIPSIILHEPILINLIPRTRIKWMLVFFIAVVESSLITKKQLYTLGGVLCFSLFIGYLMYIIHFTWAKETILISALLLMTNLIYNAYLDRNKNIFNYTLFLFIIIRIIPILANLYSRTWRLTIYYELVWWLDIFLGIFISILGIKYCLKLIKHK